MKVVYLDASAAVKLVVEEAESVALRSWLGKIDQPRLIASALLEAELLRAVRREHPAAVDQAWAVLRTIGLIPIGETILRQAGMLDPVLLRTLDAIHLATALTLDIAELTMVAYDDRLVDAARAAGISIAVPA